MATQQANQMAQAPYFQPSMPNQSNQNGMVSIPGGGMVPANHPLAQGHQQQQQATGQPPPRQGQYGTYYVNVPQPQNVPQQYQMYNYQQQSVQPNTALNGLAQTLAQQAAGMTTPDVAGQKEATKESMLGMYQQQQDALKRQMAARGREAGSFGGAEAALAGALPGQLTAAYRDIDQQNQQEQFNRLLQAAGLAGQLGGQEFQQNLGAGQFGFQQQQAGAQQQQAANQYALEAALGLGNLQQGAAQLGIQQELGQGSLGAQRQGNDIQRELGLGNLGLGKSQLSEQIRQFDLGRSDSQAARQAAAGAAAAAREYQQQKDLYALNNPPLPNWIY